jgi:hypothetical protein
LILVIQGAPLRLYTPLTACLYEKPPPALSFLLPNFFFFLVFSPYTRALPAVCHPLPQWVLYVNNKMAGLTDAEIDNLLLEAEQRLSHVSKVSEPSKSLVKAKDDAAINSKLAEPREKLAVRHIQKSKAPVKVCNLSLCYYLHHWRSCFVMTRSRSAAS